MRRESSMYLLLDSGAMAGCRTLTAAPVRYTRLRLSRSDRMAMSRCRGKGTLSSPPAGSDVDGESSRVALQVRDARASLPCSSPYSPVYEVVG